MALKHEVDIALLEERSFNWYPEARALSNLRPSSVSPPTNIDAIV